MMSRKATEYRSGGTTVPMHEYIGEACQRAYDKWGIQADGRAYVREDSRLDPTRLVITKADGSVIPAKQIVKIIISPGSVQVILAKGAFKQAGEAAGAAVATRAFYHFRPGAAVPLEHK
jgi:hypothetical protein